MRKLYTICLTFALLCTVVSIVPGQFKAKEIAGVYDGRLQCSSADHETKFKLALTATGDYVLAGMLTFDAQDASGTHAVTYSLTGTNAGASFRVLPVKWETPEPPRRMIMTRSASYNVNTWFGLNGLYDASGTISGIELGIVINPACTFSGKRIGAASASIDPSIAARNLPPGRAEQLGQKPPPPVTSYLFCTGVASPQSTIYYSGTIATTEKNTNPVHVAFFQFLKQRYSYRGPGEYPGDLQCTGVRSVEEARSVEQLYVNRDRQNKRNVIETGWTYNGAPAPVIAPTSGATPANATAITGVYNGSYRCARGPVNLKLTLAAPGDGSLTGEFMFDLPANSRAGTAGYRLSGTYDAATGNFHLDPVNWVPPAPPGYVMVGMEGAFNSSAGQVSGKITYPTCSTFEATRNKAQSAALPRTVPVTPAAAAVRQPVSSASAAGNRAPVTRAAEVTVTQGQNTSTGASGNGKPYFCFGITIIKTSISAIRLKCRQIPRHIP